MASSYHCLYLHIVFATQGRTPMIEKEWMADLHAYLGGIARKLGASPLNIGGVEDHVHLLLRANATHAPADLVREIKKVSSEWAKGRFHRFAWQTGYGAFSVSPGEVGKTVTYIENQEAQHRKVTSADELRALLEEFGVEYDERYFE
jgi:putative transposase